MVEGDGDQGGKNLKLHWLQCPKTVPKNKIWSWNWMIKKLIFGADILISDFLVESLKANKNYQKKRPLILQCSFSQKLHFANLKSLTIIKSIIRHHSQKHVCDYCQKNYLHCPISAHPKVAFSKHLEIKFLYTPVNLLEYICFRDVGSF